MCVYMQQKRLPQRTNDHVHIMVVEGDKDERDETKEVRIRILD